jgi:hypothetical protein
MKLLLSLFFALALSANRRGTLIYEQQAVLPNYVGSPFDTRNSKRNPAFLKHDHSRWCGFGQKPNFPLTVIRHFVC